MAKPIRLKVSRRTGQKEIKVWGRLLVAAWRKKCASETLDRNYTCAEG